MKKKMKNFKSKIHLIEIFRKCIIKVHGQKYHFENIKTNLKVICWAFSLFNNENIKIQNQCNAGSQSMLIDFKPVYSEI